MEFERTPKPIVVPDQPNSELVAFADPIIHSDFVRALDFSHVPPEFYVVECHAVDVFIVEDGSVRS
jgi:hypothetical protein